MDHLLSHPKTRETMFTNETISQQPSFKLTYLNSNL